MKKLGHWILCAFLTFGSIHFALGQGIKQVDSTRNQLMVAAREMMIEAGYCTLITLDDEYRPMARIMEPFEPEGDFTVWFGTNAKSRKVRQIKNNPTVTLYYQATDITGYVVIHGIARIVDDDTEKESRWKESWDAFYPNKEGYLLIKVSPEWMEILSTSRGIVGDSVTWETPVVTFD